MLQGVGEQMPENTVVPLCSASLRVGADTECV